jgi:molybdate transport repressor ModE-like protein
MAFKGPKFDRRLGRRLRLRDFQILATVVEWGSMAQAAKQVGMSQPAISEAIAQLEDALGVRLLDRNAHGAEPTIYADALLKRGNVILDELSQGLRDIDFLKSRGTGEVRVGANEFSAGFVAAVIEQVGRSHPGIAVRYVDALTGNLEFRALRDRNVDFMLARVAEPLKDEDLDAEFLFDEPLRVVASAGSIWARRRKLALADLIGERWILQPPGNPFRVRIDRAFHAQGLEPPRETVGSFSVHLRNHLVSTGQYLTVMPASVQHFSARAWGLKALPIDLGIEMPTCIVTLRNRTLSPAVEVFIQHARAVGRSMSGNRARRDA